MIPTSLKVYEWFYTGKTHQLDESSSALNETREASQEAQQTSLSMEEVDKLIKQRRVAVKSNLTLNEERILIEELLSGPYFGDGRHTAESDEIHDNPDHDSTEGQSGRLIMTGEG